MNIRGAFVLVALVGSSAAASLQGSRKLNSILPCGVDTYQDKANTCKQCPAGKSTRISWVSLNFGRHDRPDRPDYQPTENVGQSACIDNDARDFEMVTSKATGLYCKQTIDDSNSCDLMCCMNKCKGKASCKYISWFNNNRCRLSSGTCAAKAKVTLPSYSSMKEWDTAKGLPVIFRHQKYCARGFTLVSAGTKSRAYCKHSTPGNEAYTPDDCMKQCEDHATCTHITWRPWGGCDLTSDSCTERGFDHVSASPMPNLPEIYRYEPTLAVQYARSQLQISSELAGERVDADPAKIVWARANPCARSGQYCWDSVPADKLYGQGGYSASENPHAAGKRLSLDACKKVCADDADCTHVSWFQDGNCWVTWAWDDGCERKINTGKPRLGNKALPWADIYANTRALPEWPELQRAGEEQAAAAKAKADAAIDVGAFEKMYGCDVQEPSGAEDVVKACKLLIEGAYNDGKAGVEEGSGVISTFDAKIKHKLGVSFIQTGGCKYETIADLIGLFPFSHVERPRPL